MNLLPKSETEFASVKYWNTFFKGRGTKEFEWYGEYAELSENLHQYLKKQDNILVIGCGNSRLSSDLFDLGFRKITNIDISSVVITQMKNRVGKERPEMVFEQMDALNMTYESEKFTVVLDKGTLDALMPSDSESDKQRAEKLFSEIDRVLKINGRYIIISLLQKHILKELLKYFTEKGWMVRIKRCWDVEKKKISETGSLTLPVFMIVCVKFKKMENIQSILEVNLFVNQTSERVSSNEEVMAMIENVQNTILFCREAKNDIEIKFCKKGEDKPRYSIHIVDASSDQRLLLKYAAFIVPHGREIEWMFATTEGRQCLRESSGFDRLAVITLNRYQDYGSLEEIQDELRQTILQLAPSFISITNDGPQIPYLTLGDGVGKRKIIYSGSSQHSGKLVVEDVEIEEEIYRRLIFMSNQAVVQSEVKLKKGAVKKKAVDLSSIVSDYILLMSVPVALKVFEGETPSVAVIGMGGGCLCLFINQLFASVTVTGVEIDPLVVTLAEQYFGLKSNESLKVVVRDGVEFLLERTKFDIIMFDVDSKESGAALSCPPPQFLDRKVLEAVADALADTGIFVTNVVSRVRAEHEELIRKIESHFHLISWYNLKENVNRIIFASNMKDVNENEWENLIKNAALKLNENAQKKFKMNENFLDVHNLINHLKT